MTIAARLRAVADRLEGLAGPMGLWLAVHAERESLGTFLLQHEKRAKLLLLPADVDHAGFDKWARQSGLDPDHDSVVVLLQTGDLWECQTWGKEAKRYPRVAYEFEADSFGGPLGWAVELNAKGIGG